MVVEARDLAGVAQGYESDDDDLLPLDATEPMPDGDDEAALSDSDVDPAASTAAVDGSEEPQALTEETWQQRESELAAQRERDLAQLRSIKDRETQQAQTLSMHAQAREKVLWQTFENTLTAIQNGDMDADPRILYKLRHDLDQVQRTQMAQQQQQVQQGDSWVQRQVAGHQSAMAEQSKDEQGRQLFNPNDPDIARAFDAHIRGGTQQTWDAYNRAIYVKREAGLKALLTKDRTRANAAKAKARGVQSTGRGGGAGAATFDQLREQAYKAYPDNFDAAHTEYLRLKAQYPKR